MEEKPTIHTSNDTMIKCFTHDQDSKFCKIVDEDCLRNDDLVINLQSLIHFFLWLTKSSLFIIQLFGLAYFINKLLFIIYKVVSG